MIAALALAGSAALFTVLGFRDLFGASVLITGMAAAIELGKIVCVSALYQFRDLLNYLWKGILFLLILVSMAVTSMGVYGYLSSSYQRDSLAITQNTARIELIQSRINTLSGRLSGMDEQIANVPEVYVSKRMELIGTFKPERDIILTELDELNQQNLDLTLEKIDKETEFGAVLLLAKSVSWLDPSKAMLYFIFAVIIIFDPMAIALTYVANVGFANAGKRNAIPTPPVETSIGPDPDVQAAMVQSIADDRVSTVEAMGKIADAVSKVASDIESLKSVKPIEAPEVTASARSTIIDKMRG